VQTLLTLLELDVQKILKLGEFLDEKILRLEGLDVQSLPRLVEPYDWRELHDRFHVEIGFVLRRAQFGSGDPRHAELYELFGALHVLPTIVPES
jgi:hypothetical protein